MGAEWIHVDGRLDMTNLIVGFAIFATAPKKLSVAGKRHRFYRNRTGVQERNILCVISA